MHSRFYAPPATTLGQLITLSRDESQHLSKVLRLGPGDAIRVFNGRGDEFEAVVEDVRPTSVSVRLGHAAASTPEPRVAITLAQAVLKGDHMDEVVRDAVMLGVTAIQPLVTSRTEISIAALTRARRRERWERIAVSSAKQSGRATVPPVLEPKGFPSRAPESHDGGFPTPVFVLVEPGASSGTSLSALDMTVPDRATLVVGPEGGWTPEEIQVASTLGSLVTLGPRTLRADAMALVALAAMFAKWQEF